MDLNQTERKALGTALLLVGLGVLGRALLAPDPGRLDWRSPGVRARDLDGVEGAVVSALLLEQRAQTPLREGERVDLNSAPAEELRRLPGVGPGLAAAILAERRRLSFGGPEDMRRVAGIGEVTARRLAPHVVFGSATSAPGLRRPDASFDVGQPCAAGAVVIDINRAAAPDLERLPGIGPALARRIIEDRNAAGPFASPAALGRVRGIGPRSIAGLEGRVCARSP